MELNVCPLTSDLTADLWRLRGTQLGRIIESRVDEAYVLSWPGPMEIYIPLHDTGGYDRARTPFGRFDHRYDQIKGTAGRSPSHSDEVRISFDLAVLHPDPSVDLTFVRYSFEVRNVLDPAWVVPSDRLLEVCARRECRRCRTTHWDFTANPSGLAHDRARPFQVSYRELALARWPSLELESPGETLSLLPAESGPFFERRFDAGFLETTTGKEILMAPDPDVFGRDRLGIAKETYRWASLAIKGSTELVAGSNNIEAQVPLGTFRTHPRHCLLLQYYDRPRAGLHPWSWFVPSTEFERLATRSGSHLQFSTTLNLIENRWSPFRISSAEAAQRFRAAIHA